MWPKNIQHNYNKVSCLQIFEVDKLTTNIFKNSKFGQICIIKLLEAQEIFFNFFQMTKFVTKLTKGLAHKEKLESWIIFLGTFVRLKRWQQLFL